MKKLSAYSDKELVVLMLDGKMSKDAVFSELYSRYSQKIYGYCIKVCDDNDEADDIFQETFVRFFDVFEKKGDEISAKGLLITIARNLYLNTKRSKKNFIEFDEFSQPVDDYSYEDNELIDMIDKKLQLIPPEYRETFVLRYYQSMSYKEIGEILGITDSTARNRVLRAKTKLQSLLLPLLEEK
ncbi:MAG: RNA polymerase sigma factor [Candidatus Kapaibacterium sp.]|jgi:RNA polymerase sigma-70 factor (ECF subfamily)|nr:RNA polymerase sigma factor [Candidatus Kapabacteria bacterium]